ncbi:hypothetical protein DPMN_129484 [Dreissena polymorpha]|uniref:Uncharacterized protein n=1 Tax=Dreissena polymorpha TaxID=45954 RepID=A0A9D4H501_DREPO|nr:hypothetical protein DPMN_129484 [Dreissena polymorpha]
MRIDGMARLVAVSIVLYKSSVTGDRYVLADVQLISLLEFFRFSVILSTYDISAD